MLKVATVTVDSAWRARQDAGDIAGLADSIARHGQLHPITVVEAGTGRYRLVSGARRLAACLRLQIDVLARLIEADSELAEVEVQIAENVARKEFDRLEMGRGLARQRELYERAHPESASTRITGGPGRGKRGAMPGRSESFVDVTARQVGLSPTVLRDCLAIGTAPAEATAEIEAATTTRERNIAAQRALRKVRDGRRLEALAERAAKAEAERKQGAPSEGENLHAQLAEGDCMALMAAMHAERGACVDLVLTDPPYATGRVSDVLHETRTSFSSDFGAWDRSLDLGWVRLAARLLKTGGQMLAFCPLEALGDYRRAMEAAGMKWRGALVWSKTNPMPVHRAVYASGAEGIAWATHGGNYAFAPWENAGAGSSNVITEPSGSATTRLHPTQKPRWLITRLLERHAPAAPMVVLDPFAGSGTTLVCAEALGHRALGIEREPEYVRVARLRLTAERVPQ